MVDDILIKAVKDLADLQARECVCADNARNEDEWKLIQNQIDELEIAIEGIQSLKRKIKRKRERDLKSLKK